MGFFEKLKNGLSKTKNAVFGQVDNVLRAFVKVDEDLLEELEELLICSDMGVEAAEEIIDILREQIKDDRLKEPADVKDALQKILREKIGDGEPLHLETTFCNSGNRRERSGENDFYRKNCCKPCISGKKGCGCSSRYLSCSCN